MDKKFILNELTEEDGFVNCLVTVDNTLLLIGTSCIRYGEYDGNTFDLQKLHYKKLLGYVAYATLYMEPLTRKQYLLLIMQDGRIELRDLQFNPIDYIETGIRLYQQSSIVALFESQLRALYVTLNGNDIYMIRLKVNKDELLTFVHTENCLTLIQTLTSTVKQMDYTLEYDIYTNEEYSCISILSYDDQRKDYMFQAITHKSNVGGRNRNKLDWRILVPQQVIRLEADQISDGHKTNLTIVMKAVENVGFFFFSLTDVLFLTLPDGFENYIEGTKMSNELFRVQGPFLQEYLNLEENCQMELLDILNVKINPSSIVFQLYTNTCHLLEIQVDKISEDEEKYIKYWGKFKLKNSKFVNNMSVDDIIAKLYYFEQLDECLLQLKSDKLIIVQIGHLGAINSCNYEEKTFVCTSIIENDSYGNRLIRSGFTQSHRYFIEQEFPDFSDIFTQNTLYELEKPPSKLWTTQCDKIYWTSDSSDMLYCNNVITSLKNDISHITNDGSMVTDRSIIEAVDIWNDKPGNYCYLNTSGKLLWNLEGKVSSINIRNITATQLTKMVIWSGIKANGTNITIYGYDNQISIVTDYGKDTFQITNNNSSFNSISSIFYHEVSKNANILVSDIHGHIWIIDGHTYKDRGCLNINSYTTNIIGLHNTNDLMIYSKDTLTLLKTLVSDKLGYEYISLDISFNIAFITTNYDNDKAVSVTIVTTDDKIIKMTLDSSILTGSKYVKKIYTDVLINKFVKLPCSNRYFIASYIVFKKLDEERNIIDKSGLCVYDIYSQKIVTRYDIAEKFQKVIISDVCEGSYHNGENEHYQNEEQISFAKQLIFSQCFLVSLNYELCETDEGPKLLLFMLNSENGEIELQTNIDTTFNINCLQNYDKNLFVTFGEYVQLFKLDYSVQENIFHIIEMSNRMYVNGYIENINIVPVITKSSDVSTSDPPQTKKSKKEDVQITKFVGTDLLKGFYDCTLETKNNALHGLTYSFKPTKVSDMHPVINDCNKESVITSFLFTEFNKFYFILVCCGMNKIKIYYTSILEEEYDMIEFYLPRQITSCSVMNDYKNTIYSSENGTFLNDGDVIQLFSILTKNGGHYSISTTITNDKITVNDETDPRNMLLQLKYIGAIEDTPGSEDEEEDVSDYQLIDNRILIHKI